jgi:hypothetical protein
LDEAKNVAPTAAFHVGKPTLEDVNGSLIDTQVGELTDVAAVHLGRT